MLYLVSEHGGTGQWKQIGSKIGRTGKQCRERWHNQIDPSINKTPWNDDEELILVGNIF
jgi:hypothetical protein